MIETPTLRRGAALVALALGAGLLLGACGGGNVGNGAGQAPAQTLPDSGAPPGPGVRLLANDLAFGSTELGVSANQPFTIVLENRDTLPHNVGIERADGAKDRVFEGAVFTGPTTRWYAVPALAAGAYTFLCQVHPAMQGRLIVS